MVSMRIIFTTFSIVLLIYMLWPGPSKIDQFSSLPDSAKSTLEGDTIQIPNVAGYFSNKFRAFAVPFYTDDYQKNAHFPFPPIRLNHPPEYSWDVIKKHTETTYLEELVYPLRDSIYVNGYELYRPDGSPVFHAAPKLEEAGQEWPTKVTLRLYTSNLITRLIVWMGIVASIFFLFKLAGRVRTE